jgi:hypothetical protein
MALVMGNAETSRGKRRILDFRDSQDSRGSQWNPLKIPGMLWESRESRESIGNLRNPMGIQGIHWKSQESHGNPGNPLEIPGIPWESRESREYEIRCFPHINTFYSMKLSSKISQTKVQHVLCNTALYPC